MVRDSAPLPSAAPTPLGGVALSWELAAGGGIEAQLLIDDESIEYSVARRAHPKVLDHGPLFDIGDIEKRFLGRFLSMAF